MACFPTDVERAGARPLLSFWQIPHYLYFRSNPGNPSGSSFLDSTSRRPLGLPVRGRVMRVSVMVHPPAKGDSLEHRLEVLYCDGSSGVVQLPQGSTWSTVETYVETALDLDDVVGVVVFGRPAVEYRSTRGHDVDGWRVDARYSLDVDGDDLEDGAR